MYHTTVLREIALYSVPNLEIISLKDLKTSHVLQVFVIYLCFLLGIWKSQTSLIQFFFTSGQKCTFACKQKLLSKYLYTQYYHHFWTWKEFCRTKQSNQTQKSKNIFFPDCLSWRFIVDTFINNKIVSHVGG